MASQDTNSPNEKRCPNCGGAIKADASFCKHCKASVATAQSGLSLRVKILIAIIAGILFLIVCSLAWNAGIGAENSKKLDSERERKASQDESDRIAAETEKLKAANDKLMNRIIDENK